jgi:hypothetical protein
MVTRFTIKQGDALPELTATLRSQADQSAIDLTEALSILFRMREKGKPYATNKVSAAAAFVSKPAGTVKYSWITGDTDQVGTFEAEFVVTWPGSKLQTFPSSGTFEVVVGDVGLPG